MLKRLRTNRLVSAIFIGLIVLVIGILGIHQVLAYPVIQTDPPLPQIVFLGEGPDTFEISSDLFFLVKSPTANIYQEYPPPTYTTDVEERVWSVDRDIQGEGIPLYDGEINLGEVPAGCVVDYVQIDDDIDERRNGFRLGDEEDPLHIIEQGMVTYGEFTVPRAGELIFFARDSVGLLYRLCVAEPTATPTPMATGTATATQPPPTSTPPPTGEVPTGTPTTPIETPEPTATAILPELTPTPTKEPREDACVRINFEVAASEAQRGLYVVQEVGGAVLTTWYAEAGWQDSGWITGIDIPYPAVYIRVLFYSGPDVEPVVMRILNPAPDTEYGWMARGMCHALEVGWP